MGVEISALPDATLPLNGTEEYPAVQSGETVKVNGIPFVRGVDVVSLAVINDSVGIGTSSPSYKLHVVDTSGSTVGVFGISSGGGLFQLSDATTVTQLTALPNSFTFSSDSIPAAAEPLSLLLELNGFYIDAAKTLLNPTYGNVGIGVVTPTAKLHVVGSVRLASIPAYDDDAGAGGGGLTTGNVYQTTGSGAAPLNVAGILMIKQ